MITPNDIQSKKFSRSVRGYKEEEVDDFLDMLTLEFEKITKENTRINNQVYVLEKELEKYHSAENEVAKTMQQAQQLMDDISESAEKRAEIIVRNAELEAETTMKEAKEKIQRIEEENKRLHDRYVAFRDRYKKMLEDELFRFNSQTDAMFPDFSENKLEEILAEDLFVNEDADFDTEEKDTVSDTIIMNESKIRSAGISAEADDDRKTRVLNLKEIDQDKAF